MTDASRLDPMPDEPDARVKVHHGNAHCGRCGRRIAYHDQDRCPYVGCRAWLRCTRDPDKTSRKDHA